MSAPMPLAPPVTITLRPGRLWNAAPANFTSGNPGAVSLLVHGRSGSQIQLDPARARLVLVRLLAEAGSRANCSMRVFSFSTVATGAACRAGAGSR